MNPTTPRLPAKRGPEETPLDDPSRRLGQSPAADRNAAGPRQQVEQMALKYRNLRPEEVYFVLPDALYPHVTRGEVLQWIRALRAPARVRPPAKRPAFNGGHPRNVRHERVLQPPAAMRRCEKGPVEGPDPRPTQGPAPGGNGTGPRQQVEEIALRFWNLDPEEVFFVLPAELYPHVTRGEVLQWIRALRTAAPVRPTGAPSQGLRPGGSVHDRSLRLEMLRREMLGNEILPGPELIGAFDRVPLAAPKPAHRAASLPEPPSTSNPGRRPFAPR